MNMNNKNINQSIIKDKIVRTTNALTVDTKVDMLKNKTNIKLHELNPSPGKFLLPSTIGIPPRNGSPESRLRDPRINWAPAISISSRTDQPLITPQYEKKRQHLIDRIKQIKLDTKIITDDDLSHLTRLGSDKTRLPISFVPHKVNPSKRPLSIAERGPGPANYQQYKDYIQIGEKFLYVQQPHVRIRPLIGPNIKKETNHTDKFDNLLLEKRKKLQDIKPFWTTIGTRTFNSRLRNAPVSRILERFYMTQDKINKLHEALTPGPAMYPIVNTTTDDKLKRDTCGIPGVTISPRHRMKRFELIGPGPAMVERTSLDKGYKTILKTSPAFTMSSRWSPYSHTFTDECSDNFL